MKKNAIHLEVKDAEGALVRVLGLSERRGYRPKSVQAEAHTDGAWMKLRLSVETRRPIEQLVRQLNKLIDVRAVEVGYEAQ